MNDNGITLTLSQQRRLTILSELESRRLTNEQAAELLGITERHLRRLRAAFRRRGVEALVHGNRGRRPVNAVDPDLVIRAVKLATTTYTGFNQHHLAEMLAERENLPISRSTLQRVLALAGVRAPRQRRPAKHRQRRDRYPREGMLLQPASSPGASFVTRRTPRVTSS